MRNFLCILSDPPPAPALESLLGFLEEKPVIGWKLSYDCSPQRLYTLMLAHIQSSAIYHNLWFNLLTAMGFFHALGAIFPLVREKAFSLLGFWVLVQPLYCFIPFVLPTGWVRRQCGWWGECDFIYSF